MIYEGTRLEVADNSGAKVVQCIRILGSAKFASIGQEIVVSIKQAIPKSKIAAGEVCRAVVVRTRKQWKRKDGTVLQFYNNAVVLLDKQKNNIATRIFGAVPRELKATYSKIVSLASEVL